MTTKTQKVAPIPRGFRSLTPHVLVADVSAAAALYQRAFGAVEVAVETAPGADRVAFAHLRIGNSALTLGQGDMPDPGQIGLHHYVEDFEAAWDSAVKAGFIVMQPPHETYWGDRMGILIDPMGVRWSLAQRVARVTPQERAARALEAAGFPADPAPLNEPVIPSDEPIAAERG
ncbi:VOC family protein [Roseovarius spongiae]|uniref:VOC family protein n=1 Tax=Roseovarius spongiae TaxID=2320272 RepID=A0A3A8ARY0_9RHOB|nr:VOC family protein [Roseovarius spongiae]RKF12705.1 VOC family protein [Roseovarius spongiae]